MKPKVLISSAPLGVKEYLKEIFKYKHLVVIFARQELRRTYAQTVLGVAWAVLKPLFTLLVFTVVFQTFLNVHTHSPYYLFAFAGIMAWNFFSQIALGGSVAITQKQGLIRKMYFPKIVLPLAVALNACVELFTSVSLFFMFLLYQRHSIPFCAIWLPFFILLNGIVGLAVAIWMSVLNIKQRDLNHMLPVVVGIAVWLTPVFYPTTVIPSRFDFLLYANPLAGIIKGFRFALLGEDFPGWQYWVSIIAALLLLVQGGWVLNKSESEIIDYL